MDLGAQVRQLLHDRCAHPRATAARHDALRSFVAPHTRHHSLLLPTAPGLPIAGRSVRVTISRSSRGVPRPNIPVTPRRPWGWWLSVHDWRTLVSGSESSSGGRSPSRQELRITTLRTWVCGLAPPLTVTPAVEQVVLGFSPLSRALADDLPRAEGRGRGMLGTDSGVPRLQNRRRLSARTHERRPRCPLTLDRPSSHRSGTD